MPVAYRGDHLPELDGITIDTLASAASAAEGAPALIELRHLGGAMTASTGAPNSATSRGDGFHLWVNSPVDPALPEAFRARVDGVVALAGATVRGAQLNFLGPAPTPGRSSACGTTRRRPPRRGREPRGSRGPHQHRSPAHPGRQRDGGRR